MAGARQDWGGMQAKAPRGWPQPDPMGCKCALGPPSTQLRQVQSPEDHARRNHRACFEAKAYQGLGTQDMVRRIGPKQRTKRAQVCFYKTEGTRTQPCL